MQTTVGVWQAGYSWRLVTVIKVQICAKKMTTNHIARLSILGLKLLVLLATKRQTKCHFVCFEQRHNIITVICLWLSTWTTKLTKFPYLYYDFFLLTIPKSFIKMHHLFVIPVSDKTFLLEVSYHCYELRDYFIISLSYHMYVLSMHYIEFDSASNSLALISLLQ